MEKDEEEPERMDLWMGGSLEWGSSLPNSSSAIAEASEVKG